MATGASRSVGRALNSQRVFSWGANSYGQLAAGHCNDTFIPEEIPMEQGKIKDISGGGGHTLMISDSGNLLVCGCNEKGQLGLGSKENMSTSTMVKTLEGEIITKADGGWDFTIVLNNKGQVFMCGSNSFGQLGLPGETQSTVTIPTKLDLTGDPRIIDIAAGLRHCVALTDGGQIYTWGGRIKDAGKTKERKNHNQPPIAVHLPEIEGKVIKVKAGSYHSAVLTDCGEIIVWGDNKHGQLTISPEKDKQLKEPVIISRTYFDGKVKDIQSGWTHMVALTDSHKIYSWGRGDYGQLGREVQHQHDPTPQQITGVENIASVKCGSEHNLALTDTGKLLTWGWNEHGLCGNGNEVNVSRPQTVDKLSKCIVKSFGCGAGHSFAMINDT